MKDFLWLCLNDEGVIDHGRIKGIALTDAVIIKLRKTGDCFGLTPDEFSRDKFDRETIRTASAEDVLEIAIAMLNWCRKSYIDGDSANQVAIYDIQQDKFVN